MFFFPFLPSWVFPEEIKKEKRQDLYVYDETLVSENQFCKVYHTRMHTLFLAMKTESLIILTCFQVSLQSQPTFHQKPLNFKDLANT